RPVRARSLIVLTIVAVDALVLFVVPELSAPRSTAIDSGPASYLKRHLGTGRFFTLGPLAPNYGSYYRLPSLNANDIPIPSAFGRYVHTHLDPWVDPTIFVGNSGGGRSPYLPSPEQELLRNLTGYRRAGVSYVLTPAGQALPQSRSTFTLVDRTATTWIYHLAGAAPYLTSGCAISSASRTDARVNCPRSDTLVRRETDLPGWTATVDGHRTPVRSFDGIFQAVRIPAGRHHVRFAFTPPGEVWGLVGFLVGAVALLFAVMGSGRGLRRPIHRKRVSAGAVPPARAPAPEPRGEVGAT
ncbi:MAG TPA: YfhO family protein, partial [Solirubrobacteraceae bacterium]|nr:YfhO family protein [Solirubrobacteraceae bacterium]